ncbi:MAG: hypothetical protein A2104_04075 [Candidatus Melainabacteria bacterium GWF2_32_7]|nr:MAG: hypothetical protein A2104_04075 [Candidatus Melainabacteria bacterium GWF2_32_7]
MDMDKETIKEALNNHRLNKTILWNSFLWTTAGTIGLIIKDLNTKSSPFDLIFIVIGVFFMILILHLNRESTKDIQKLWLMLKKKGDKENE